MQGRHYGSPYSLTPMVKKLIIINAVVWVLNILTGRSASPLYQLGAISVPGVFTHFFIWQPFTYMFLHDPFGIFHVLFNMFVLWMFGGEMERAWGSNRFLRFYLSCGIGAGFFILAWHGVLGWQAEIAPGVFKPIVTVGASGAIFGLLTAFSLTWPDRTVMLIFPPIPMRAIWFVPLMLVLPLLLPGSGNVSYAGHIGGVLIAGFIMRKELSQYISFGSVRMRWHRYRMRNRLRAVRREEWERRKRGDDDRPTYH